MYFRVVSVAKLLLISSTLTCGFIWFFLAALASWRFLFFVLWVGDRAAEVGSVGRAVRRAIETPGHGTLRPLQVEAGGEELPAPDAV